MRKLMLIVIGMLAIFTFIREFAINAEPTGVQKAQTETILAVP